MSYIYNITFHCSKAISSRVLNYLQARLIPAWQEYDYLDDPKLMRVHVDQDGLDAYCIHWIFRGEEIDSIPNETQDPYVLELMQLYPEMVMAFGVLLSPLPLES